MQRAAGPLLGLAALCMCWVCEDPAGWPGGDRLSRCLSNSTMGAEVFHGRVRDGIGCINLAMTTGPPGRILCGNGSVGAGAAWCCVRCRPRTALRFGVMGVLS